MIFAQIKNLLSILLLQKAIPNFNGQASLFAIALLSTSFTQSCSKEAPVITDGPVIHIISGNQQVTSVGEEFPEPIIFQVVDGNSGVPIPSLTLYTETKSDPEDSAILVYSFLTADSDGMMKTKAVGGRLNEHTTKFRIYIKGSSNETEFELTTSNSEEDALQPEELEKDKLVETPNPVPDPIPTPLPDDLKVDHFIVNTQNDLNERAGIPFSLQVLAVNKDNFVVPTYQGKVALEFSLRVAVDVEITPTSVEVTEHRAIDPAEYIGFPPVLSPTREYTFNSGIAEVPIQDGTEIRKLIPNYLMFVFDPAGNIKGESKILNMREGNLMRVEIASSVATPDFAENELIGGENHQNIGGFELVIPSITPAEVAAFPPISITAGISFEFQSNGFDQFENLYEDPIPSTWTGFDTAIDAAGFPNAPEMSQFIAMRGSLTGNNLLIPTKEAMGYLRAEASVTRDDGSVDILSDETGVLRVATDVPTSFYVDLFEPIPDGSLPPGGTMPVLEFEAGKAYWMRVGAGNSSGLVDVNWNTQAKLNFTFGNTLKSSGWPLPVDAAISGATTLNNNIPQFDNHSVYIDGGTPDYAQPLVTNVEAVFINGYAWIRTWNGVGAPAIDVELRTVAEVVFYNSGETPRVAVDDSLNSINGNVTLKPVLPTIKSHLKIAFSDVTPVPVANAGLYPSGIDTDTELRDYEISVGNGIVLSSLAFDEFGNKIGFSDAMWEGINGLPSLFLSYSQEQKKFNVITPDDLIAGPGGIRITDPIDAALTDESGALTVVPGLPNRFEIAPIGATIAGSNFGITITAVDKSGNVAVNYDAANIGSPTSLKMSLTGADLIPPLTFFADAAAQTAYQTLIAEYKAIKIVAVTFNNGVATILSTDPEAFKFFYTSEKPQLAVSTQDESIQGSSEYWIIDHAPLHHLNPVYVADVTFVDMGTTYTYNKGDLVGDMFLIPGVPVKIEAKGYDVYENFIDSIATNWANTIDDDDAGNTVITAPEYVGNPLNFAIETDSSFTVYSSTQVGKTFIQLTTTPDVCTIQYVCDPAGGPVVSYTGTIESHVGPPTSVKVYPTNPTNPAHVAGTAFSMKVELSDLNGQVATSYNDVINISQIIANHTPGQISSVFGNTAFIPTVPSITMVAGVGQIDGFIIYSIYDSPTFNIDGTLADATPLNNSLGTSVAQEVVAAGAEHIKVINIPQNDGTVNFGPKHRPSIFDTATNPLNIYPTTNMKVWSGFFDIYGNWVSDASNVEWTADATCNPGAYNNNFMSPAAKLSPIGTGSTSQYTEILSGVAAGKACILATNKGPVINNNSYYLTDVVISEGVPTQLKLTIHDSAGKKATQILGGGVNIEAGFQLIADEPLRVEIEFYDGGNSLVTAVNEAAHPAKIEINGATVTDTCQGHGTAQDVKHRQSPANPFDPAEAFTVMTALTQDVTWVVNSGNVDPSGTGYYYVPRVGQKFSIKVMADYNSVTLTPGEITDLEVIANSFERVNIRSEANGGGDYYQATTQLLTTDTPLALFAAGYDRLCNFIADEPSSWTGIGTADSRLFGDMATGSSIVVQPISSGAGTVKAFSNALADPSCNFCGVVDIDVAAGQVTKFVISSEHSGTERATIPFSFTLEAQDAFDNIVPSFAGAKELIFLWTATDGPNGFAAQTPAAGTEATYTFTGGILDLANFADVQKKLIVALAGQTVSLKVSHNTGTAIPEANTSIVVIKGPITLVKPYDVTATPVEITGPINIEMDQFPVFALRGYDTAGNDYGDLIVNWTSTGSLSPEAGHLDKTTGDFVVIDPDTLGASTLVGTYQRIGDPDAADQDLPSTIDITVVPGKAKRFLLFTQQQYNEAYAAGPVVYSETAGTAFSMVMVAVDDDGFVDTFFDATDNSRGIDYSVLNFNFAALDVDLAWPSNIVANFPPTFTTPIVNPVFTLGIATVPGFTLFNADETSRFSINLTTSITHLLVSTASNMPIEVDPNITDSIQIVTKDASGNMTRLARDSDNPATPPIPPITTDNQKQYFSVGQDEWTNFTVPLIVNWTGTNAAVGKLLPATDDNTYLAPDTAGFGRIQATPTTAMADSTVYESKIINFVSGSVDHFDVIAPGIVVANVPYTLTIVAKDQNDNPVTSFPDGEIFELYYTNANPSPNHADFPGGGVEPVPVSNGTPGNFTVNSFSTGDLWSADYSGALRLTKAGDQATIYLKWVDGSGNPHLGNSGLINVVAGPINFHRITKEVAGTLAELPTDTNSIGDPLIYYANGYDNVGNFIGNQSVLWAGTEALQPILRAAGNTNLIADGITKIAKKVKATLTGLAAEAITGTALIEIRDSATPATLYDSVAMTLNPGPPAKIAIFMTDGTGNIDVTGGAYTVPQVTLGGQQREYRIEAQDIEGNRSAFSGPLDVNINLPVDEADKSSLGFLPTIDQPGTITFVNGLYDSESDTKYMTFNKSGSANMTAVDNAAIAALSPSSTNVSVSIDPNASLIRFTAGTADGETVFQPSNLLLEWVSGSDVTVYATSYDAGGNWRGPANATWTGGSNLANPIVPTGSVATSLTMTPMAAGSGNTLQIDWDHDTNGGTPDLTYQLTEIKIKPSSNYKEFVLNSVSGVTTTADNCVQITVEAHDVADNLATSYDGTHQFEFSMTNAFSPDYAGMANPNTVQTNGGYVFATGTGGPFEFCLRDITAAATITIKDPITLNNSGTALTGTYNIAVTAGNPHHIEFADTERDGVGEPEAAPNCEFTTDVDTANYDIFASVHDIWGNIILSHDVSAWTWSATGVLVGNFSEVTKKNLQLSPTVASLLLSNSESNIGTLTPANTGALEYCNLGAGNIAVQVHVKPGAPVGFDISVNSDLPVIATNLFTIALTAKDQYDNVAWTIDSYPAMDLSFAWVGADLDSPTLSILTPPAVQTPILEGLAAVSFTDGSYTTAANSRLPNALQDEISPIKITAITPNDASILDSNSGFITVVSGLKNKVYLTEDNVDGDPVVVNMKSVSYKEAQTVYAASYDLFGNFVAGGEAVTWAIQGFDISGVTPGPSYAILEGAAADSRVIKTYSLANGQQITGAVAEVTINHVGFGAGALAYTVNVKFTPDPASQFVATKFVDISGILITDLTQTTNPIVTAGSDFYVVIEAQDSSGNIDVLFPADFDLSTAATMPDKNDISVAGGQLFSSSKALNNTYTFNFEGGPGKAQIGPFNFVNADATHDLTIDDADGDLVIGTPGTVTNINVAAGAHDHAVYLTELIEPPTATEILLTPLSIASDVNSFPLYTGTFDEFGNYIGVKPATFTWAWDPACPGCEIVITGDDTSTALLTPSDSGSGRLTAIMASPLSGTAVSPLITVDAGLAADFVISELFVDQNIGVAGTQPFTIANFKAGDLSTARVFADEIPSNRYQRVGIGFSLRIEALDAGGNHSDSFCDGHLSPDTVARVCNVEITFAIAPSPGPDTSASAPVTTTVLPVRWNMGWGTFVTSADSDILDFPFDWRLSGDSGQIIVTEEAGVISGMSVPILMKTGVVDHLKLRNLANDSGNSGLEYIDNNTELEEGKAVGLVSAGYDLADNYIADISGDWTVSDNTKADYDNPTALASVSLNGLAAGNTNIAVTIPADPSADAEYTSKNTTVVFTVQPGQPLSLKLTLLQIDGVTPQTPIEVKAGDLFKLRVDAMTGLAGTGVVASGYAGLKNLVFQSTGAEASDLGMVWQSPTPDNGIDEFTFASGVAVLNDMMFTGPENSNITFTTSTSDALFTANLLILNKIGDPGEIRIKRGIGSLDAIVEDGAELTLDTGIDFWAHKYDKGGNWIGLVLADWSYFGTQIGSTYGPQDGLVDPADGITIVNSVLNENTITTKPKTMLEPNSGKLTISDTEGIGKTFTVNDISVIGNTADHFKLTAELSGSWLATQCYIVSIAAEDAANGAAPYYEGSKTLNWSITLADDTTPYPTLIGGVANPAGMDATILPDGDYLFSSGSYSSPSGAFCLEDATGNAGAIRIKVSDPNGGNAILGTVDVTVNPGPASLYTLNESENTESVPVCNLQGISAGETKNYWIHETDAVGNYIRQVAADFTTAGSLAGTGVFSIGTNGGAALNFLVAGTGTMQYDFPGSDPATVGTPATPDCNPNWIVAPGPARIIGITNENTGSGEIATVAFNATVTLYDEYMNLSDTFSNTIDLDFTSDAQNSPFGQQPLTGAVADSQTGTINATFANGVWTSGSDFQFKLANASVSLDAVSLIAGGSFGGEVHASGLVAGNVAIDINPGISSELIIRDGTLPTSSAITNAWAADLPANEIRTVGIYDFYAAEADMFGNPTLTTNNITWELVNGDLPDTLTPASGGLAQYDPDAPGSGTIRITSTEGAGALVGKTFTTAVLTVIQTQATEWQVAVWNGSNEVTTVEAGVAYSLRLRAVDGGGSLDNSFAGAKSIDVRTVGFTPSPVPFLTDATIGGVTIPNENFITYSPTFNAAEIIFTAGIGYVNNVILTNADDQVTFSIQGETLSLATTPTIEVNSGPFWNPQVRYSDGFGVDSKTTLASLPILMNLLGIDALGNTMSNLEAIISIVYNDGVSDISDYDYALVLDSGDEMTGIISPSVINSSTTTAVFNPIKVGRGFFKVECTDTICRDANATNPIIIHTAEVTVVPGPPNRFLVEVEGAIEQLHHTTESHSPRLLDTDYIQTASLPFDVRVTAVDLHDNIVKTVISTSDLAFEFDLDGISGTNDYTNLISMKLNAPQSPADTAAGSDYTFNNGVWISDYLNGTPPANQPFILRKAGANPYLMVTALTGPLAGITGKTIERIVVNPGVLTEIEFRTEANQAGTIHLGSSCGVQTALSGETIRLYPSGRDAEGNAIGDINSDWSIPTYPVTVADQTTANFTLSNFNGATFDAASNSIQTPSDEGDWKVTVTSVDFPTVTNDFCVNVDVGTASKIAAHIIIDVNGNLDYGDTGDSSQEANGPDGQIIEAGQCFSLELLAQDAAGNLDLTYNQTITVDFITDSTSSALGLAPVPSTAPLQMTVTFVNGRVVTPPVNGTGHPTQDASHLCATAAQMGSFVLMTTASAPKSLLRVSDGAGIGLEDGEIHVEVTQGSPKYVALMTRADGAAFDEGAYIGISDITNSGQDMTADSATWPSNIYNALDCNAQRKESGICVDPAALLYNTFKAGEDKGIQYHRFYLNAYDSGGNYLASPNGDWSATKTNLVSIAATDAQWTMTDPAPVFGFFEQFAKEDATYTTKGDDDADVTFTSSIFYHPMASNPAGRIAVSGITDAIFGADVYVVGAAFDIATTPGNYESLSSNWSGADTLRLSDANTDGGGPDITYNFYDGYNNGIWVNDVDISMKLYDAADVNVGSEVDNPFRRKLINPTTKIIGGASTLTISGSELAIKDPGDYAIIATATINTITKSDPTDTFRVWTGAPTNQIVVHTDLSTDGTDPTDICHRSLDASEPNELSAAIFDKFGNFIQYVDHGWYNTTTFSGYSGDQTAEPIYKDIAGTIVADDVHDGYKWAMRADISPKGGVQINLGENTEDNMGKWTSNITYTHADGTHPLNTTLYGTVPNVPFINTNINPSYKCGNALGWTTTLSGLPYSLAVDFTQEASGLTGKIGDTINLRIRLLDNSGNDVSDVLDGKLANFDITFSGASIVDSPDLCAKRFLTGAACTAAMTANSRLWGTTPTLIDAVDDQFTFSKVGTSIVGWSTSTFVTTNANSVPVVTICFKDSVPSAESEFLNLIGYCSPPTTLYSNPADPHEIFIMNQPGGQGQMQDAAPQFDAAAPLTDRTYTSSDQFLLYGAIYDKYGNFVKDIPDGFATWSVTNVTDEALVSAATTLLSDQMTGFANANPIQFGSINRAAAWGDLGVTFGALSLSGVTYHIEPALTGLAKINTYSDIAIAAPLFAASSWAVGDTIYMTIEIRTPFDLPQDFDSITGTSVIFSEGNTTATRYGNTASLPPSDTDVLFCNGTAVVDGFDFGTNCPGDGSAPPLGFRRIFTGHFESTLIAPTINVAVNVSGLSHVGVGVSLDLQNLGIDHYVVEKLATDPEPYLLNYSLNFAGDLPATIDIYASDSYGNNVTVLPATETNIILSLVDADGNDAALLCSSGTLLAACIPQSTIFECSSANCLASSFNMFAAAGHIQVADVKINRWGAYHITAAKAGGYFTFDPGGSLGTKQAQIAQRSSPINIEATIETIDQISGSFPGGNVIAVGTANSYTIEVFDKNARKINDPALDTLVNSSGITWPTGLLAAVNGSLPESKNATGFDSTLNLVDGIQTLTLEINTPNSSLPVADFKFTLNADPSKTLIHLDTDPTITHAFAMLRTKTVDLAHNNLSITDLTADSTGLFNLRVSTTDLGGNYFYDAANASQTISMEYISGPAPNNLGVLNGASLDCTIPSTGASECFVDGMWLQVGAKVKFGATSSNPAKDVLQQIQFNNTGDTIAGYELIVPITTVAYDGVTGNPSLNAKAYAYDGAGNRFDDYLTATPTIDAFVEATKYTIANLEPGYASSDACGAYKIYDWTKGTLTCQLQILKIGSITSTNLILRKLGFGDLDTQASNDLEITPNISTGWHICEASTPCGSSGITTHTAIGDGSVYTYTIAEYDSFGNSLGNTGSWSLTNADGALNGTNVHYTMVGSVLTIEPDNFQTTPSFTMVFTATNSTNKTLTITMEPGYSDLVIIDTGGAVTAGNGNFSLTSMNAVYTVASGTHNRPDINGIQTMAIGGTYWTLPATVDCTFTNGVCSTQIDFDLIYASDLSTQRTLEITLDGITKTFLIDVIPDAATNWDITGDNATWPLLAGECAKFELEADDQFNNLTSAGIRTANLTTNRTPTTFYSDPGCSSAITSISIPDGETIVKIYYSSTFAAQHTVTASGGGLIADSTTRPVIPGTVTAVRLATTDAPPGATIAAPISCGDAAVITCPEIFAWGFDDYDNPINILANWTYANTVPAQYQDIPPSGSTGSSHSTILTHSSRPLQGTLTASYSIYQQTVSFSKAEILVSHDLICGAYLCYSGTTIYTECTATNNTGFASSGYTFTESGAGNMFYGTRSGVADGASVIDYYTNLNTGDPQIAIGIDGTPVDASWINMPNEFVNTSGIVPAGVCP